MSEARATPDDFYTPQQVRERLKVKDETLRRWRRHGKGPPFTKLGNDRTSRIRYPVAEFHQWEETYTQRGGK